MTSLDALRRFAVTRSLFPPTTLRRAIAALGFVQADPIRAPARAQDLTLRPRDAVPHWRAEVRAAQVRARQRLSQAVVDGQTWYWPAGEVIPGGEAPDTVRLLAPFDPVVWDRRRFELLWDWAYRFEAYTPEPKRKLGYYALPLLWRDRVVGWANVSARDGEMKATFG